MEKKKVSIPTILAAVTLLLSVSGWAVKTTVSNMLLENRSADLQSKVHSLTEDLRWCRIYGVSFPMMMEPEESSDSASIITIPPYLLSDDRNQ